MLFIIFFMEFEFYMKNDYICDVLKSMQMKFSPFNRFFTDY